MTWAQMQAGELDWWKAFLARPNAIPRLFALYGYRYLSFFFEEFNDLGDVIDFGSGPVSAAWIADTPPRLLACVDPLSASYAAEKLLYTRPVTVLYPFLLPPLPGWTSAAFDTALVFNVLDHAEDPATLLGDVATSLKPGGKALIWVHVDAPADALHRTIGENEMREWLAATGLSWFRSLRRQPGHGGPDEFMALAIR